MPKQFIVKHKDLEKKEDIYTTTTIRIPRELLDRFEEIANKSGRSRNELITMAMEYAMDNLEFVDK